MGRSSYTRFREAEVPLGTRHKEMMKQQRIRSAYPDLTWINAEAILVAVTTALTPFEAVPKTVARCYVS